MTMNILAGTLTAVGPVNKLGSGVTGTGATGALSLGSNSATAQSSGTSAVDQFMAMAKMTPAQRMRAQMLQQMGLTEDKLKAMSPTDRQKVEDQIRDRIKDEVKNSSTPYKAGSLTNVSA